MPGKFSGIFSFSSLRNVFNMGNAGKKDCMGYNGLFKKTF